MCRVDAGFAAILRVSMVTAGMLLAVLMVGEVFLRYVVHAPFIGAEEVSVLLGLWLYAMGMIYAARIDGHIAGGILTVLEIGKTARKALDAFALLVCVLVSGVYAYYSLMYTIETFGSTQISSYLRWPYWLWTASLTVGFVMMTMYFLAGALRVWRAPRAGPE